MIRGPGGIKADFTCCTENSTGDSDTDQMGEEFVRSLFDPRRYMGEYNITSTRQRVSSEVLTMTYFPRKARDRGWYLLLVLAPL